MLPNGSKVQNSVTDLGSWIHCSIKIYKRPEKKFKGGFLGMNLWVGPEAWLRSAHPFGGAACRDHAQYPAFAEMEVGL